MNNLGFLEIWGPRQELVKAAGIKHFPSGNTVLLDKNMMQEPACSDRISFRTKIEPWRFGENKP